MDKRKSVLVTGGARGIGKEVAIQYAEHGYDVIINYISDKTDVEGLKKEFAEKGIESLIVKADVSKQEEVESLVKQTIEKFEKAGHGGRIEGAYIDSDRFNEMKDYAESKKFENSNPERKEYSLRNNNCGTFAADVLKQDPEVKGRAPMIIDPRPNSIGGISRRI